MKKIENFENWWTLEFGETFLYLKFQDEVGEIEV